MFVAFSPCHLLPRRGNIADSTHATFGSTGAGSSVLPLTTNIGLRWSREVESF